MSVPTAPPAEEPPADRPQSAGTGPADEPAAATAAPPPVTVAEPTPIYITRRTRNVLIAALVLLAALIVWAVPSLLIILLGGATVAILLSFPVGALERIMPRWLAIAIVSVTIVVALVLLAYGLAPVIADEFASMLAALPDLLARSATYIDQTLAFLGQAGIVGIDTAAIGERIVADLQESVGAIARGFLGGTVGFLFGTISAFITAFGIVFVAVALLINPEGVRQGYLRLFPANLHTDAQGLWSSLKGTMAQYLGGLIVICFVQGALTALALWILGLPYALALGFWVSVTAVVPYLGAWLGAVPAVLVGLSISPGTALITTIIFVAVQQLESNLLTPAIQGHSVKVPPVVIFLGVFVGGALFGIVGIIFAVPVVAALRVVLEFFGKRLRVREASPG